MTFLRRLLGVEDAPPWPLNGEAPVNVESEAERHFDQAVREAQQAMARAEMAHKRAIAEAKRHPSWESLIHSDPDGT